MVRDLEPAEGKPNYTSFLIAALTKISEAWDNNQPEKALMRTLRFTVFLPTALKERIQKNRDFIKGSLKAAYQVGGVDFYTLQRNRNREARRVATLYLEPFLDEIIDWLDQRGYLEVKRHKVLEGHE